MTPCESRHPENPWIQCDLAQFHAGIHQSDGYMWGWLRAKEEEKVVEAAEPELAPNMSDLGPVNDSLFASEEHIVTNEVTGGKKGRKPARHGLIPPEALDFIARVYGKGAEKYTRYGECTCTAMTAAGTRSTTPEDYADHATTDGSGIRTRHTPKGNERTTESGPSGPRTENAFVSTRPNIASAQAAGLIGGTGSRETNTTPILPNRVESVDSRPGISTTITPPGKSGEDCVIGATSGADISKAGLSSTKKQHLPGCPALTVTSRGEDNWRLGYDWSLSYDALQRHLNAFWSGEDLDPESGLPHLAHAAFHVNALLVYSNRVFYDQFDDRPNQRY